MTGYQVRTAGPDDAEQVARLHADSWRRHYRGAYADSFLDGDVEGNRLRTWAGRLAAPGPSATLVVQDDGGLAGFVHMVFDDDARWGSLVDNLHVRNDLRRSGIGRALLASAGQAVLDRASGPAMYLWVLEQNTAAQAFYKARGGGPVERTPCRPAGIPMQGEPYKLRMAWATAAGAVSLN
jgi:ribosomal protein S18 acetylase RimI-like enzyme